MYRTLNILMLSSFLFRQTYWEPGYLQALSPKQRILALKNPSVSHVPAPIELKRLFFIVLGSTSNLVA